MNPLLIQLFPEPPNVFYTTYCIFSYVAIKEPAIWLAFIAPIDMPHSRLKTHQ
jgi:hypothetical protein